MSKKHLRALYDSTLKEEMDTHEASGFTGSINDKSFKYYRSLGGTGSLSDMSNQFSTGEISDGGGGGGGSDPIGDYWVKFTATEGGSYNGYYPGGSLGTLEASIIDYNLPVAISTIDYILTSNGNGGIFLNVNGGFPGDPRYDLYYNNIKVLDYVVGQQQNISNTLTEVNFVDGEESTIGWVIR